MLNLSAASTKQRMTGSNCVWLPCSTTTTLWGSRSTFATQGFEKCWCSHYTGRDNNGKDPTSKFEKRRGAIALFVKYAFLSRFNSTEWCEVVRGRVAVLRLRGNGGDLDSWKLYVLASDCGQRQECIISDSKKMQPSEKSLSICLWTGT